MAMVHAWGSAQSSGSLHALLVIRVRIMARLWRGFAEVMARLWRGYMYGEVAKFNYIIIIICMKVISPDPNLANCGAN